MRSLFRTKTTKESGFAALAFVTIVMLALVTGVALLNWINVRRKGDLGMRLAIKEAALGSSAIDETRYQMLTNPAFSSCTPGAPQTFSYTVGSATVTITIDCL